MYIFKGTSLCPPELTVTHHVGVILNIISPKKSSLNTLPALHLQPQTRLYTPVTLSKRIRYITYLATYFTSWDCLFNCVFIPICEGEDNGCAAY